MEKNVIVLSESQLIKMIHRIIKEDSMVSDDAEPIEVMRINKKDLSAKKMSFYEYEVQDGYLVLFNDESEITITFDTEFKDVDYPKIYVYKPMNN